MRQKRNWIPWASGLLVLGLLAIFGYRYLILMVMSPGLQQEAEGAFAAGITLEDPKGDYVLIGSKTGNGKPNNPIIYDLGFDDIRSLSLGADEKYLYCKVEFWGRIPDKAPIANDDRITGTGIKLNLTDDQGVDQEIWMLGFGYLPVINLPTVNTYYFYHPTGIQSPEDKRFSSRGSDSKIAGGAGYDYVIGALPVAGIGLTPGQTVYLSLSVETASKMYDHAAVDVLGGQGKMPAMITWKLGASSYQIDHDFRQP